jgi:hypothetical protein
MKNSSLALDGAQRRGYSNGGFFSRFKSACRVEADIRTVGKQPTSAAATLGLV